MQQPTTTPGERGPFDEALSEGVSGGGDQPSVAAGPGSLEARESDEAASRDRNVHGTIVPASPKLRDSISAARAARISAGDDALTKTIRRWAKPTTVDDLARRGVRKVHSVSMTRIAALLEKAVNRTLIERTLESGSDEALTLSHTARDEFLRLSEKAIQEGEDGTATLSDPLRSRATSTLDRLKRELVKRRQTLADHERQLSEGELDAALDQKLARRMRELFVEHAGRGDDRALEEKVVEMSLGELRVARRSARLARLEEHQREINKLERRIAKLSVLLGETEDALRKMREGRFDDVGVSSIYDSVQGLDERDEQYEHKSSLMKVLFEANMAMR